MPNIAFFSNDDAGELCARMAALGLAQLGGPTILALPDQGAGTAHAAPGDLSVVSLAEHTNAFDVERLVLPAARSGADVVAALPLDRVRDEAIRRQFDAAIVVGHGQASGARALRAARYEAFRPGERHERGRHAAPAWFLAWADQSVLMTKARLCQPLGPSLPFATRALPMVVPRMSRQALDDLRAWRPEEAVLGTATLLAALALAIASDPTVADIAASDVAAMMASRELPAERRLAERLVGLAEAYGRLTDDAPRAYPDRPEARSRERRRLARPTPLARGTLGARSAPLVQARRS